MKKWILGLGALVLALAIPMQPNVAYAEEPVTVSVSDNNAGQNTKLAAPTNLRWEGWVAKWDAVEGAVSYKLQAYKDGKHNWELNVGTDCSFDFANTLVDINGKTNTFLGFWGEKEYAFSIVAVAADEKNNSEKSAVSAGQFFDKNAGLMESGQLAVPTNLAWGDNYSVSFDAVRDSRGYYDVQIYKDGEYARTVRVEDYKNVGTRIENSKWTTYYMDESGTYKLRVRSSNRYDTKNLVASEWSEFTEEKVYVKPEKQLPSTVGKWDPERPGIFLYNSVEGTDVYRIALYCEDKQICTYSLSGNGAEEVGGVQKECDFSGRMTESAKYFVRLKLISSNLDELANGVEGAPCEAYDTTKTAEEVSGIISGAVASGSAVSALDSIQKQLNMNEMSVAMQTDENVLSQMKDLEAKYIAETGVSAVPNAEAVKDILDTSKVSMVGAALNGVAGSQMSLDIAVPEKTVDVDKKYADTVQLDIKLTNNGASVSELKVPITITIPVPNSLKDRDIDHLTLLHYSSVDGSHEEVKFKDNGDGTVTFTVTHFSTFVFATEESADTSNKDDNSNEDDNNDESYDDSNEEVKATEVPVKDSVPKTGDSFPVGMLMLVVVCMLGAIVVRKRA